jgi:hypothetical protein
VVAVVADMRKSSIREKKLTYRGRRTFEHVEQATCQIHRSKLDFFLRFLQFLMLHDLETRR